MSIEEIKQAIANGLTVKWLSSGNIVKLDNFGSLVKKNVKSGFSEYITTQDLEDCFI